MQSIFNQTYQNIEIIYLDNASNDDSYEIGKKLLGNSQFKFQFFRNTEPASITKNLNFLLQQSTGEYVLPLSTDDWLDENCISSKISFFKHNPGIGFLYSKGYVYYENMQQLHDPVHIKYCRGWISKSLLKEKDPIYFVGIMYPRKILHEENGWDENMLIEDLDLFYRISLKYPVDYVPEYLVYYRKMKTSASENIEFMVKGWEQFYTKYKKKLPLNKWLAEKYRSYAALAIDKGAISLAKKLLMKSFF